MSIEIRQLVVNATVEASCRTESLPADSAFDTERLKGEIMAACREMIRQQLQRQQER